MFQFIHAADIHLDSPLQGLEAYEGAPADEIRSATRRALENLVDFAIERAVRFVLIAGDLYDGDRDHFNTGLFFVKQVTRLRDAGIPVYVIRGNHDAASKITKSLPLPENPNGTQVLLSSRKVETIVLDDLGVAIHGCGFAKPKMTENILDRYPAARKGLFNIGMLHTSLDTESEERHARYAPCKLDDLRKKGYDYWALGHIHGRAIRSNEPPIVFPGNIQGRHIRETGAKGAMLVTVDDDHRCEVEFQPFDVFRWEEITVCVDEIKRAEDLLDCVGSELKEVVRRHAGMPLAVRIVVTGRSLGHETWAADPVYWSNQLRAVAIGIGGGDLWVEKVRFRTELPHAAIDPQSVEGPIGEIVRTLADLREEDEALRDLATVFDDLRKKLPDDLEQGDDGLGLVDLDRLRETLDEVEPLLLGRLHALGGER